MIRTTSGLYKPQKKNPTLYAKAKTVRAKMYIRAKKEKKERRAMLNSKVSAQYRLKHSDTISTGATSLERIILFHQHQLI